jgi:hypothetical protein
VAQEAFGANLIMEYQVDKEDAAATAFARRLGFVPFAERILITFKDDSPSPSLRAAELQLSTPTQTIDEVLSGQSNWEAIKEKYGEPGRSGRASRRRRCPFAPVVRQQLRGELVSLRV